VWGVDIEGRHSELAVLHLLQGGVNGGPAPAPEGVDEKKRKDRTTETALPSRFDPAPPSFPNMDEDRYRQRGRRKKVRRAKRLIANQRGKEGEAFLRYVTSTDASLTNLTLGMGSPITMTSLTHAPAFSQHPRANEETPPSSDPPTFGAEAGDQSAIAGQSGTNVVTSPNDETTRNDTSSSGDVLTSEPKEPSRSDIHHITHLPPPRGPQSRLVRR